MKTSKKNEIAQLSGQQVVQKKLDKINSLIKNIDLDKLRKIQTKSSKLTKTNGGSAGKQPEKG